MSTRRSGFPATTARVVAGVALVGTLALVSREPVVGLGALSGIVLAVAIRGFTGSIGRMTIAGALLPIGVLGAVASTAVAIDVTLSVVVLAVPAVLLGLAVVAVLAGGVSDEGLRRAGSAALYGALVAGCVTVFALYLRSAGDLRSALETVLWLPGSGVTGLAVSVIVAGGAVAGGLLALPRAAYATPRSRDRSTARRNGLAVAIGVGIGVVLVLLGAARLYAGFVSSAEPALAWVVDSHLLRSFLLAATVLGLVLVVLGLLLVHAWGRPERTANAVIPVVAGAVVGTVGPFALAIAGGFPSEQLAAVPLLFGLTAVLLGIGGLAAAWYADSVEGGITPGVSTVLAGALVFIVVASEATGGAEGSAVPVDSSGLASLVALAAGLVAFSAGRYGRTLAREVGPANASRRPQLVRLGWTGAIAAVGLVVAVFLLWASTVLAPTLSVPSTAGTLAGLAAVLAGAWLLLR